MSDRMPPLHALFAPRVVAVIGATDVKGKIGHNLMVNLLRGAFKGRVYPVNPFQEEMFGLRSYPEVGALPERPDLAVIATPADVVPQVVKQCAEKGVSTALIISSGFREIGPEGAALETEILNTARKGGMRIVGPNCLGVMNPQSGLNATFAGSMAARGSVAFLSQSGALCAAVLDWSLGAHVGFSAFVSIGAMLDIGWGDLIQYFGDDPHTRSIVIYMESVGDARAFVSAAREVALKKPIIVIKAGRTEGAARATISHTGCETGSDAIFDMVLRRCGVLRVNSVSDVFYMSEVLSKQPRPQGPNLTIVTNAGGPGVLATDALIAGGCSLTPLTPESYAALNEMLPPQWSHGNPIDLLGNADVPRYEHAIQIAVKDPNTNGLLVILTPQGIADPTTVAQAVVPFAKTGKPVIACWMGGNSVREGTDVLNAAGIPTLPYPDTAARFFTYMWQYSSSLRALYETPSLLPEIGEQAVHPAAVQEIILHSQKEGRTELTDIEAQRVLQAYGIPSIGTAGPKGIDLSLSSEVDSQFGPVLRFGLGGLLARGIPDHAYGLPPLTTTLARRVMERTRVLKALQQARVDQSGLEALLIRFSRLVVEHPRIRSIRIDPLVASAEGLLNAGAVEIALWDGSVPAEKLPKPAIRPYPHHYVAEWTTRDGTPIVFRPIRPEDEPMMVPFHESLSELSVYMRYFGSLSLAQRTAHERLTRVCFIDYDREIALVAEGKNRETGANGILAVGRVIKNHLDDDAEFAVVVSDSAQGKGLGTELLRRLIEAGRSEGVHRLYGWILPDNYAIQKVCRKLGFDVQHNFEENTTEASMVLR